MGKSTRRKTASRTPQKTLAPAVKLGALLHPLTALAAISVALTALLHWLFFLFAPQIWAMAENLRLEDLTSWTRYDAAERDGAEPQVLLLLVLALIVLTAVAMHQLEKRPAWLRMVVVGLALCMGVLEVVQVPPRLPWEAIDPVWWHVFLAEAGVLLVALAAYWVAGKRRSNIVFAVALIPACFLAVSLPSRIDLQCVLAPALKLRLGFSPAQIYFQYDYLLSCLAVGWHWLGGGSMAFSFCTQVSYYLLMLGSFLLARKMFAEQRLAGLLLVALCAVRIYATMVDANALPQVTPLRLDLWILLLAPAWRFGLRHWSVGLAAGLICFFVRSFGVLELGAYALAISADFLNRRVSAKEPVPFWRDVGACVRQLTPALIFVGAALLAIRLVFGALVSDAVIIYRRLGIGMIRISTESFYWWIAPMLAAVAWLGFSLRGRLGERKSAAALFAVALAVINSLYFFGRSHEHNLINISASLLFCAFFGMDLALVAWRQGARWVRWTLHAVPWLALACVAFFYSGRLIAKIGIQAAIVTRHEQLSPIDGPGPIVCGEIAAVAKDSKVFVYSQFDFWFYDRCQYVPPGYFQPIMLQPIRAKLIEQLNQLLDAGYKIVVPKVPGWQSVEGLPRPGLRHGRLVSGFDFAETEVALPRLEKAETAHYWFYWRGR